MTAASPEPTDGSWAAPAGPGSDPVGGDGTSPADASPPRPPAHDGGFAPLDGRPAAGPWATPPTGWRPPGGAAEHASDVAGPYPTDLWPPQPPQPPQPPRVPWGPRLRAAGLTAAVVAVIGAPLGLLWAVLAPGVPIIKTDDGAVFATPSPEEFIASDGWFTILLFTLGVLAALVTWIAFKRYRGPLTLVALVVGTVGASVLAWQVGRRIGIGDYRAEVLAAQPGDLLTRPPDLRAGGFTKLWDVVPFVHGDLLIATFGAVIVYTLLAGWSRTPSLHPEAAPPQPAPVNPFYTLDTTGTADDPPPGAEPSGR
ncbi:DUF2567 domain-containing protein [Asanoa siamensis]|uniref:DUF2567 domain-containing protein n=1 Tax=Asanoa siamensis TaxID=926357 RepID=A0ABQ4D4R1_9ACTN|nr:DUF2567 domain-containing protein [Asanoa siamensis]GIF78501.1 hypothetical protein Asi02nite_80190 [Asanoa siamensis]